MSHDVRARYYEHLAQRNERIIEMHRTGASNPAIARAFGLDRNYVRRLIREANNERRDAPK